MERKVKWKNSRCILLTKSYQESMEKQLNSSGQNVPGFSSLQIIEEIQRDLERKSIDPDEFTDRIIFMSMFNDIDWTKKRHDEIWNAEKVKDYKIRFLQGHWTLLGPRKRSCMVNPRTLQMEKWTPQQKMVHRFKETGHPVFKSISSLSRGILKRKKGKETIHFNGDSSNTELLFRIFHSLNQQGVFYLGQLRLRPILLRPSSTSANLFSGARRVGGPKFRAFLFFLSRSKFRLFFALSGVFSWNLLWSLCVWASLQSFGETLAGNSRERVMFVGLASS